MLWPVLGPYPVGCSVSRALGTQLLSRPAGSRSFRCQRSVSRSCPSSAFQPRLLPLRHSARGRVGPEVHGAPFDRHCWLCYQRDCECFWPGQRGEHLDHRGGLGDVLCISPKEDGWALPGLCPAVHRLAGVLCLLEFLHPGAGVAGASGGPGRLHHAWMGALLRCNLTDCLVLGECVLRGHTLAEAPAQAAQDGA
ncbi:unnamed protein product [Symbiodinium microadriaticum]|nr:unnamed protein product [Symbiodinium microadriaticum]